MAWMKTLEMWMPLLAYLVLVLPALGFTLLNFALMGYGFSLIVGIVGLILFALGYMKK